MEILKENTLLELEAPGSFPRRGRFNSRVEELRLNTLLIAVPIHSGALVPLRLGEGLNIYFVSNQCAYTFSTHILGRSIEPLPILEIKRPLEYTKIQRRNYVRLPLSMNLQFVRFIDEEAMMTEGRTIDLSGGGLQFQTKVNLTPEEFIELRLNLSNKVTVVNKAKVVRVFPKAINNEVWQLVAVQYIDLKESQREMIIKYIFDQQRELIKKGLL
ncbi:MAG: flagellar brake protein [Chitinophagales bacterium]